MVNQHWSFQLCSHSPSLTSSPAPVLLVLRTVYHLLEYIGGHCYCHSWTLASRLDATGIRHLSPVQEHSGTGLGTLIPVPDKFRHRHHFSFGYRTNQMPGSPAFQHYQKLCTILLVENWIHPSSPYTAAGGVQLCFVMLISKCWNAKKKLVRHRHFC